MTTTISGTMLVPGVSKNGRLYRPDVVRKAYDRLAARIADGTRPATMLTHHAAGDDSTKIVGQVTKVNLNGDRIDYTAALADTAEARTIAALTKGDRPFLKHTSIRGAWIGPVRRVTEDGQTVDTADDLEIDGLDFTKDPGVLDSVIAQVTTETAAGAGESVQRTFITESVESAEILIDDTGTITTVTPPAPPVAEAAQTGPFADPGYQPDKAKRYPVDTKPHALAAWSYINQKKNAAKYTPAQLKRVKQRIKTALKKFGVTVDESTRAAAVARVCEAAADAVARELEEAYASINLDNGPASLGISTYLSDPSELPAAVAVAAKAAVAALNTLDPDNDGDIDGVTDGDPSNREDCQADLPAGALFCPTCGQATTPDDDSMESATTKEPTVAETTGSATAPAGPVTLTGEQFQQLLARTTPAVPAAAETTTETAPAAATTTATAATETAPAGTVTTETVDVKTLVAEVLAAEREAMKAELRAELRAEAAAELGRKGYRQTLETTEVKDVDGPTLIKHEKDIFAAAAAAITG